MFRAEGPRKRKDWLSIRHLNKICLKEKEKRNKNRKCWICRQHWDLWRHTTDVQMRQNLSVLAARIQNPLNNCPAISCDSFYSHSSPVIQPWFLQMGDVIGVLSGLFSEWLTLPQKLLRDLGERNNKLKERKKKTLLLNEVDIAGKHVVEGWFIVKSIPFKPLRRSETACFVLRPVKDTFIPLHRRIWSCSASINSKKLLNQLITLNLIGFSEPSQNEEKLCLTQTIVGERENFTESSF